MITTGVVTNASDRHRLSLVDQILNFEKSRVVKRSIGDLTEVIDFGSGDGSLISYLMTKYPLKEISGVELDPISIQRARENGVKVHKSLTFTTEKNLIMLWHSLEHLNHLEIDDFFDAVTQCKNLKLIISVPSGSSKMFEMFQNKFAFYDEVSHVHQFTNLSLNALLAERGFQITENFRIHTYGIFAAIQTALNSSESHNKFYDEIKRGKIAGSRRFLFLKIFLQILLKSPIILGLLFYEFSKKRRSVTTVLAERNIS
jgi:SAM-dependent methyltransferase